METKRKKTNSTHETRGTGHVHPRGIHCANKASEQLQGYLAHKKQTPTAALCLGPYGGPGGGGGLLLAARYPCIRKATPYPWLASPCRVWLLPSEEGTC